MKAKNANEMIPRTTQIKILPKVQKLLYLPFRYFQDNYQLFLRNLSIKQTTEIVTDPSLISHQLVFICQFITSEILQSSFQKNPSPFFIIISHHSTRKMGQNNSNQTNQNNRALYQHLKNLNIKNYTDYQYLYQKDDESIAIRNIQNNQYYELRILTVAAEEDSISLAKILEKRNKISCVHLCKIVALKKQHESLACSQIYKLHLLIECPLKTARTLLEQKLQKYHNSQVKQFFREPQLWGMAYSIVKALKSLYLYGIVHQSLSLQSIFIDDKGLIKVADPALFGLEKNYITAMKQKQECKKILSPEILVFLDEYNFYFYQKQKSDVFVLGILLLQLSTLNQFPVYDYKEKMQRFQLIEINLNQVRNRYSQKFYTVLEWMTQVEPKKRPRLGELLDFIDKSNGSQKSTSISNTVVDLQSSLPTNKVEKQLERNRTVSHFTIQPRPFENPQLRAIPQHQYYSTYQPQPQPLTKERKQTEQSKDIFPFQLVYNRIINNNQNMKPFQIKNLYKQYRYNDIFGSSCRGSVPSSSYHARIQQSSREVPNKNLKMYDRMAFSKKTESQGDNLMYSQSSAFHGSNKLQFSKNTLGDIKLVESNHLRESVDGKIIPRQQLYRVSNIIEDVNQQTSIDSPYRQLASQRNSQGKSLNSVKYLDIEPIVNQQKEELSRSDVFQQYAEENKNINIHYVKVSGFQSRYFSQEKQKNQINIITGSPLQVYQSEFLAGDAGPSTHFNGKKESEVKLQEKYDKYLLSDKIISKENSKQLSSKQITYSFRNVTFQSSQIESKLSKHTPNFDERSHKQIGTLKEAQLKNYNYSDESQLLFVQNDISEEGSIYTGYKNQKGCKQRHGKLEFHDGGYYQGQWKNDKMEGYGELYYANGLLAYKGLWVQGCFSGNGQIFNDKPLHFQDPFNYTNFTEIEDKWFSYDGEFDKDSKHGKGRINLTNGQYFQGLFDYDMIEGEGAFYTKNGQVIQGLWKDNELVEQYDCTI